MMTRRSGFSKPPVLAAHRFGTAKLIFVGTFRPKIDEQIYLVMRNAEDL